MFKVRAAARLGGGLRFSFSLHLDHRSTLHALPSENLVLRYVLMPPWRRAVDNAPCHSEQVGVGAGAGEGHDKDVVLNRV